MGWAKRYAKRIRFLKPGVFFFAQAKNNRFFSREKCFFSVGGFLGELDGNLVFLIFCGFSFGQNRFTFDLCKSWVDSCSKSGQKFGFSCEKKWCLDALIKSTFATLCFFFLVEQTLPAANGTFFGFFPFRFVSFGKFRFFVFLWGMVRHYLFF